MLNKLKLKKSDIINVTYYALGALVTGTAVYLMTKNHYENIIVNLYETAEA